MTETFAEIFEQDARWLTGEIILANYIKGLRDKSLIVAFNDYPDVISIGLPDTEELLFQTPYMLKSILIERINLTVKTYLTAVEVNAMNDYVHQQNTPIVRHSIQNLLFSIEHTRRSMRQNMLYQVAGQCLGVNIDAPNIQFEVKLSKADVDFADLVKGLL